ncbi:hypothetical protein K437DRAFT_123912 [Tilletiaria anomala UBC 951]|uniref:Uncharacterized protein n=1 Tax=Tilletiaria anomala (strain ATCC 24038 / CBS 436.72 / UBC 951) TaxID=1037660 RepID=A0A066VUR5_TILAU|nr:uncharacterized protein K437DRAFT_123912 [Tilletiaria anomala UBC 951]KDN45226.1 hypothetical protein K437DRAFT_123912 [Tilletiaria anomala UBC 951]
MLRSNHTCQSPNREELTARLHACNLSSGIDAHHNNPALPCLLITTNNTATNAALATAAAVAVAGASAEALNLIVVPVVPVVRPVFGILVRVDLLLDPSSHVIPQRIAFFIRIVTLISSARVDIIAASMDIDGPCAWVLLVAALGPGPGSDSGPAFDSSSSLASVVLL